MPRYLPNISNFLVAYCFVWSSTAEKTIRPPLGLRASFSHPSNTHSDTNRNINRNRKLVLEEIAGYTPLFQVTDENAIDLDVEEMEDQLSIQSKEGNLNALRIYTKGANSKSVALVNLDEPLADNVLIGTTVTGVASNGNQVSGTVVDNIRSGSMSLSIKYDTTDSQNNYVGCKVAASNSPVTEGCLASTGTLSISGMDSEISYSYDTLKDTISRRTLQSFSTDTAKYENEDNTYGKFVTYYGELEYSNQIVLAAFEGKGTINFQNFVNNFGKYAQDASRNKIVQIATVHIGVWMKIHFQLADAMAECGRVGADPDAAVNEWDVAVAYYTGSLEGMNGSGPGNLLYDLADKRCGDFMTCGDGGDSETGPSGVNIAIFEYFNSGQGYLKDGDCLSADNDRIEIEQWLLVPLIQSTLRAAWKAEQEEPFDETIHAEATAFALSVAPMLYACDPDATVNLEKMVAGSVPSVGDYRKLLEDISSIYDCLGIDKFMVGVLTDAALDPTGAPTNPSEDESQAPTTQSSTTQAPTTQSPSQSLAPTDLSPTADEEDPTTQAPTTPSPSESISPTEAAPTAVEDPTTLAPTTLAPTVSASTIETTNPTASPMAPTEAPEPTVASIADLIIGPTPQLVELAKLPTPAALTYVSTNIQRPSNNILPEPISF